MSYYHDGSKNCRSSRRRFIWQSALATGAAVVLPAAPWLAESSHAGEEERRLGVALVGLGNYSTGQLGPALRETRKCFLAGIVTGTPAKEPVWKNEYGIPESNVYNYDNFDDIADNPDIDIVYVVLPPGMHAEYTIRAARAGKHVICEKPMAVSVHECEEMIAACNEAGRKLSIGYRLHFDPYNLEMMRLGQEQTHGRVKVVEAAFGFTIRNPDPPHIQWRLDKAMAGGGALPDVGIYAIQGTRYVIGEEPFAVTAQEYKTNHEWFREVDETLLWQMEFPNGAVANCGTSYNANFNRLFASADRGWFELSPAYSYGGLSGQTHEGPMDFTPVNQQAVQMDDFADCILNDRPSPVSGEEGLQDLRIMEAIYRAADSGARVELER